MVSLAQLLDLCCGELDEPNAWGYLEFCEDEHPHPHYPPYPYPYPCPPYPCPPSKPKRAKIKLHVKCACPQYKDHFIVLTPPTPQANVYTDVTTWLAANPGARFGSVTDLEHSGWLLHVLLPI